MRIVVGVTGASGAIYGYTLIQVLAQMGIEVHAVYTEMGEKVLNHECGVDLAEVAKYARLYHNSDLFAPIASGSFKTQGMVVVPCSMHTLGAMANGTGEDLLTRAADVTLKEGRRLVVVPRETPVTVIHLENMLRLSRVGAVILPASPAFYFGPQTLSDLVAFIIGKILDALAIEHNLFKRWGE
ncbi:UbiX family flavin prenyltransferase [Carboxydothermus hydrogenoformans]|uniref:Flavin prenyltransferase UbiX n=1 Tax=Carboxydothermus hydrogenoformans (strain ATCC BAA-161 / DSM 6008 / Z-2901) TaxID=246194 RepID=Q3AE99_CARHZ|nr:UbiX family flavin prenyltransferase [Carboxydothermus hydrogenoformans]ABB13645.1 putative 3-octaprenyl-4-hydroxybenzoate carboxy-lyase [Carboxydothermus hydrogenoformans Z-2901]